jgi:hypothetical protein
MPKVSEFYGIQIMFYLNDHGVPHFHARYAGKRASIAIDSLEVLEGSISPRASRLVFEMGHGTSCGVAGALARRAGWSLANADSAA